VEWAIKSFDELRARADTRLMFVVLKEHIEKFKLDEELKKLFGSETIIISAEKPTGGQAETALLAEKYIDNFQQLIIYNCDTFSSAPKIEDLEEENLGGLISVFESSDPRYSYAKNDRFGYVEQTAEKKLISNLASTGMYYFRRGRDFVSAAKAMIAQGEKSNNEFYIIPCYNELIARGLKIKAVPVSENWVLGTPEELKNFEKNYHGPR